MSMTFFFLRIVWERKEEGRKEGRKERRKEGRKEAKKERNETRRYPPYLSFFTTKLGQFFLFDSCIYLLVILLLYIPLF